MPRILHWTLILLLISAPAAFYAKAQTAGSAPGAAPSSGLVGQARDLLRNGQCDQAVVLLEAPAAAAPQDFELNALLARALNAKCEAMKARGDRGFRQLIEKPYAIGVRLYREAPGRPEPYHLMAQSLVINDRPHKAAKSIRKALYYAGTGHADYPDYLVTLGDCWTGLLKKGDRRGYNGATEAYRQALALRPEDEPFKRMVESRLATLKEVAR